ncbi:MAG: DinB family protein [Bacteroidetes bacterium]|nr:DinB family protein [Bacteroidota bacterium]
MKIARPNPDEFAPYYDQYISRVKSDDPVKELSKDRKELVKLFAPLKKKQLKYRYATGKWSPKEILGHIIDAERVFCYRAMRFARNDKTELPGFDENSFATENRADKLKLKSLLAEYVAVRNASIAFFKNLNEEELMRTGVANGKTMSVRALLYVIAGHQKHHLGVIRERYLNPDYKMAATNE